MPKKTAPLHYKSKFAAHDKMTAFLTGKDDETTAQITGDDERGYYVQVTEKGKTRKLDRRDY